MAATKQRCGGCLVNWPFCLQRTHVNVGVGDQVPPQLVPSVPKSVTTPFSTSSRLVDFNMGGYLRRHQSSFLCESLKKFAVKTSDIYRFE